MRPREKLAVAVLALAVAVSLLLATRPGLPAGQMTAAFDVEFMSRPDGYPGLRRRYGLNFAGEPLQMDPGLMYTAVAEGSVDVIDGFATDGRIEAYGLVTLEDDRRFFPPYQAAPVVRGEVLAVHSEIYPLLSRLAGRLDDETMRRLNFRVDESGEPAREVARDFLDGAGLLGEPAPRQVGSMPIVVGGKHFTEQEILGEMIALLLEHELGLPVTRRLNLGGTMICFNALKSGDIHVYAEYTGTALVNILKMETTSEPKAALETVRREFAARFGLVWLEPLGFDNTYTLTMKRERAGALGIETISDLARRLGGGTG